MLVKLTNENQTFYYILNQIFSIQTDKMTDGKYKVKFIFVDPKQPPITHIVNQIETVNNIGEEKNKSFLNFFKL